MIGAYSIGSNPLSDSDVVFSFSIEDIVAQRVTDTYPAEANFSTDAFKDHTPAGTCLEFFDGALFFAINNFVYRSKTFDAQHVDIRATVVAGFPANVTMIKAVVDGIYVGTTAAQYFLARNDSGFAQTQVATQGIIKGSGLKVDGAFVPKLGVKDDFVILWASPLGIFVGGPGGKYLNLSTNTVSLPAGANASATFVNKDGKYQYIVSYTASSTFINRYSDDFNAAAAIPTKQTWVVNTLTGAHSRYSEYPMTGLFQKNNVWYGTTATGLVRMGGTTDDGAAIESFVQTAATDFGKSGIKLNPDVYLDARCDGLLTVDVLVDELMKAEGLQVIVDNSTGMHRRKVKMPRGLRGSHWQFKIKNADSSAFTIAELLIKPVVSQRISH